MNWAHFLHIYQPSDQHPGILDKIANESYRPIVRGLFKTPNAKVTLNMNAVLSELLFANGFRDVIDGLRELVDMGKVELTGSAKYHGFLPLLPEEEVKRQIILNHQTNQQYFGKQFNPKGFFPPEMAYSPKVAKVIKDLGYEWILVDEVSVFGNSEAERRDVLYQIKDLGIKVYFREKRASNIIMGALVRTSESLERAMGEMVNSKDYVITAMDGETFGHHRPGLDLALFEILDNPKFPAVLISDLPKLYKDVKDVVPMDSTWATSVKDANAGNPFNLWHDNSNPIHKYEWELADLAIRAVENSSFSDKNYPVLIEQDKHWEHMPDGERENEEKKRQWIKCRDRLDKALNSDPWWWASAKPWWSVEMIEKGMFALYKLVTEVPDSNPDDIVKAEDLYKRILFTAHDWQRNGKVDQLAKEDSAERRIPLSKRFNAQPYYHALLDALNEQEITAVKNREYEQAIKWRDSQYKLEKDLDIYDAVHIMDLFRSEGDMTKFEELLKEYKEKYNILSKGQPE